MARDFYDILGVQRDAGNDELKKAYRRLAMKYHPDRNPDDADAQDKFKEVKEAYEILKDPKKRGLYDQYGHEAVQGGAGGRPGGPGFGGDFGDVFGDIFGDIFGGARGRGGQGRNRGSDLRLAMELDLKDAVNGIEKEVRVPSMSACDTCQGSGSASGRLENCTTCGGAGQVRMQQGIFSVMQTCPRCRGAGQSVADPCNTCNGQGRVQETRTLSVKIPAGVDNGDRIRLTGKGEAGAQGGAAGDLYVEIRVLPHPLFEREGDTLHCDIPIPFTTAALGGEIKVPTLEGSVILKIPAETQSGRQFKLRHKGVRSVRSNNTGDLICRVHVETPVRLNSQQKELLRNFEETFDGDTTNHNPRSRSWVDSVRDFFDRVTG